MPPFTHQSRRPIRTYMSTRNSHSLSPRSSHSNTSDPLRVPPFTVKTFGLNHRTVARLRGDAPVWALTTIIMNPFSHEFHFHHDCDPHLPDTTPLMPSTLPFDIATTLFRFVPFISSTSPENYSFTQKPQHQSTISLPSSVYSRSSPGFYLCSAENILGIARGKNPQNAPYH